VNFIFPEVELGQDILPLVSVIVPHYNGFERLDRCLTSLEKTIRVNLEIIVADDCSTDNSADLIQYEHPTIKIVKTASNSGYGTACNTGFKIAKGEFVVFLNNDTEVEPDWAYELISSMIKDAFYIATPKILFLENKNIINAEGGSCDKLGMGVNRNNGSVNYNHVSRLETTFYGSACLAVKASLFEALHGYDESYYMYSEDVDLCWRAHLIGHKTLYVPSSIVYHSWMGTTKSAYFSLTYQLRNSLTTIIKNYSLVTLIYTVPASILLMLGEVIYFSISARKMSKNILSGIKWNLINIRQTLLKRRAIQKTRIVRDAVIKAEMETFSFSFKVFLRSHETPILPRILSLKLEKQEEIIQR
jgi:GT2 family glycosyltransferase